MPVAAGIDARVVRLRVVALANPGVQQLLVVVSVQDARTPPRQVDSAIFSPGPADAPAGFVFGLSAAAAKILRQSGGGLVVTVSAVPTEVICNPTSARSSRCASRLINSLVRTLDRETASPGDVGRYDA